MTSVDVSRVVLVVEDQPANFLLARATLERIGCSVVGAGDAEEARRWLENAKPDLILMDVGLPGLDGLSFTRELKALVEMADIPIVALTAHAMKSDEEQARSAGCDGYISKPFSPRQLGDLVNGLLSESQ